MSNQAVFLVFALFVGLVASYEVVPRASRLRSNSEIRRSPIPLTASFAPLAKSLRPTSTGIRRAPESPPPSVRKAYKARAPVPRAPLNPLPTPPSLTQPLVPLPMPMLPQFIPVPVPIATFPTFPNAEQLKEMPTLGTFPPHTFPTFTPIPGMPTMPGLTMPPSFQRLLGITTSTMKPEPMLKRERVEEEQNEESHESRRAPPSEPSYTKDLNTVRSRLSKFVRGNEKKTAVKAEEDADWIVPFH